MCVDHEYEGRGHSLISHFIPTKVIANQNGTCIARVLPYMGYIGMCGPKGYSFSALLVINWVSILAILPPFWS